MKDENLDQTGNSPEEGKDKIIEVAKERLNELDEEQLENLSGGAVQVESDSWVGCSCDRHSCN